MSADKNTPNTVSSVAVNTDPNSNTMDPVQRERVEKNLWFLIFAISECKNMYLQRILAEVSRRTSSLHVELNERREELRRCNEEMSVIRKRMDILWNDNLAMQRLLTEKSDQLSTLMKSFKKQ